MTQFSMIAATTDDFLFNSPNGYDTFVLQITGFTVDGKAINVPGLNSGPAFTLKARSPSLAIRRFMVPARLRCCSIRQITTAR